jgi:hypothetical protein
MVKYLKPNIDYKHFSFNNIEQKNILRLSSYQQKFQHASRSAVETFTVLAFAKLADIPTSVPHA